MMTLQPVTLLDLKTQQGALGSFRSKNNELHYFNLAKFPLNSYASSLLFYGKHRSTAVDRLLKSTFVSQLTTFSNNTVPH